MRMNKKFNRLISLVLTLALLISAFSVLSFASTESTAKSGASVVADDEIELIINRPFDEGWTYSNGFKTTIASGHNYDIEYEEDDNYDYNYYLRVESVDTTAGYLELSYGDNAPEFTTTVLEMDFKTDDYCDFGSPIIYFTSGDAETKGVYTKFPLVGISANQLLLPPSGENDSSTKPSYVAGNLGGEWLHFAIAIRVDQRQCPECGTLYDLTASNKSSLECKCTLDPEDENSFAVSVSEMTKVMNARVYFSYSDSFSAASATKAPSRVDKIDLNNTYYYDISYTTIASVYSFFLGVPTNTKTERHSYCVDNVKLYNNATTPTTIPAYLGYGSQVDVTQAKTEEIVGSDNGKTTVQHMNEGLVMKVNFEYCVDAGTKRAILADKKGTAYGAPVKIDGEVYVPLQAILEWIGYPLYQHDDGLSFDISTDKGSTFIAIGRKTATVNGKLVDLNAAPGIATDDVTGEQYIVVSKDDISKIFAGYYVTYDDIGLIVVSEGENLFNRASDLNLMLDVMKGLIFGNLTAQQYYDLVKANTNNFQHPYIVADQEQFDALHDAYLETDDAELKAYLDAIMASAEGIFTDYTAIPAIQGPAFETPFKLALFQKTLGDTFYFTGKTGNGGLLTSAKTSEAVDVYLEEAYSRDGSELLGFRIYFYNESGVKNYLRVYESAVGEPGYGKGGIGFTAKAPTEYFTYNSAAKTFVVTSEDGANAYYLGASQKAEIFTAYNTVSISGSNENTVDKTQFPARLVSLVTVGSEAFGDLVATGTSGKNTMYEYLFDTVKNPYSALGNNGYDGGGRNPFIVETTENIKLMAFAYQISGDEKYAVLAYELYTSISLWTHWAPAYFLDCAEATANVAIAYDWLYNVWSDLGYDLAEVESVIYKNGLLTGYNYTNGIEFNESLLSNQGVYSIYNTATDSWNVIGTSAMAITSLALLGTDYLNNGFVYDANFNETESDRNTTELGYVKAALNLLVSNIESLYSIGLDMYAPDGTFIESATKWSDATSSLMLLSWTLDGVLGTDLGFSDTWALDKTFYFAYQVEYKTTDGYKYWAYNDAIGDVISTDFAYYAASVLEDITIAAIRTEQIGFKPVSMWDILAYDPAYVTEDLDKTGSNFALDYTLESCEGIISRSSWKENALYVGLMGNANDAPGGQVDAGNFVYANNGVMWFADLGAETHTVYGYSEIAYRYGYYRHAGEGANIVLITTKVNEQVMPYGQAITGSSYISDYYSDENGMYAIVNTSDAYLDKVTSAKRGLLLTNNRKTVVVQDEIVFKDAEECAWVSQAVYDSIAFSDGNRTALLSKTNENGQKVYLRATIIDSTGKLSFSVRSAYDNIMSSVYKKDESQKGGEMYTAELDRNSLSRLVITQPLASTFRVAIVFEATNNTAATVEYEYQTLDQWGPSMITDKFVATEVNQDVLSSPSIDDVMTYATQANGYLGSGNAFMAVRLNDFFRALVRVYNCEFWLGAESIKENAPGEYAYYEKCKEQYDAFQKNVNTYINDTKKIAANMCGYEN